jgi:cyclase
MALKNPYKTGGMFEGASNVVFENAKQLRKTMTESETFLWSYLKAGGHGFKVRRQHPIGMYIADFYCHKAKLIIEIDGSIHNNPVIKEKDSKREKELESWGYRIIRFKNEDVLQNVESVLKEIANLVNHIINKSLC